MTKEVNNIQELAKAIFTVNKHAKTALDKRELYNLKKSAIDKLLKEGKAKKLGLHFSPNPKNCQQRVDLLIEIGDYLFHIPPTKEDRKKVEHLGERDKSYRNPKSDLSLKKSKTILSSYIGAEKVLEKAKPKTKPIAPKKKKRRVNNEDRGSFLGSYFDR